MIERLRAAGPDERDELGPLEVAEGATESAAGLVDRFLEWFLDDA